MSSLSKRRSFLQQVGLAGSALLAAPPNSGAEIDLARHQYSAESAPLFISTWPFGKPSNERALETLKNGGSLLDAVEKGINLAENDPQNSSVGFHGIPNSAGVVQLDACIMNGADHKAGSVAALEGILHPVSVARRVMEKTPHVMLVGAGAREFALANGFKDVPKISPEQEKIWKEWKRKQIAAPGHDTIALLGLGHNGVVAGGCSTSGLAYKLPGRVGDSPILGSGLYVDNDVGAAGATGVGENVMRFCGSFMVVQFMSQGLHPTEACVAAIRAIMRKHPAGTDLKINFIALNKKGEYGGAGTGQGFDFAVAATGFSKIIRSPGVTAASTGPIGGNQPNLK